MTKVMSHETVVPLKAPHSFGATIHHNMGTIRTLQRNLISSFDSPNLLPSSCHNVSPGTLHTLDLRNRPDTPWAGYIFSIVVCVYPALLLQLFPERAVGRGPDRGLWGTIHWFYGILDFFQETRELYPTCCQHTA